MTLREEINEVIAEAQLQPSSSYNKETDAYLVNKIVKIFEKRIDSKIEEYTTYLRKNLCPPDGTIIIDRRNGLIEFKKEMLE